MLTATQRSEAMKEIGRSGGQARAKRLTPEQRSESARKAAKARWKKRKKV